MSKETPVEWEPTKTETPVDEPTKNEPTEAEQQTARAIRAEKALKEKEALLNDYEAKKEEERIAKLEEEKNFWEIKSEWSAKEEDLTSKVSTYETELERMKAENKAYFENSLNDAIQKVPEAQREKVQKLAEKFEWVEKISFIKELTGFTNELQPASSSPSFKNEGIPDRVAVLETKFSDGSINGTEYQELLKLRA